MQVRFGACSYGWLVLAAWSSAVSAQNDGTVDFSDKMTPVCEVVGLNARPPEGWFNVPIESGDEAVRGCQMMRAREGDDALVGIARVLSIQLPDATEDPPWWAVVIGFETEAIAVMGYSLGEVLWSRENVAIQGAGFSNARAVGLESRIEGNDTPQEAHFLVFEKGATKYVVTLLSPARSVDGGEHYNRNVADFGLLIRGFTDPEG